MTGRFSFSPEPRLARPRKNIEPKGLALIELLAGYGLTEAAIAHACGISPETFARRKKDDPKVLTALEKGKAKAQAKIGQALYEKAVNGDLGAIVWWEKTRAGRTDRVDHTSGEKPITTFTLNLGALPGVPDGDSR